MQKVVVGSSMQKVVVGSTTHSQAVEVAWMAKSLPYKQEAYVALSPQTRCGIPVLESQRQANPWGLMTTQSCLCGQS